MSQNNNNKDSSSIRSDDDDDSDDDDIAFATMDFDGVDFGGVDTKNEKDDVTIIEKKEKIDINNKNKNPKTLLPTSTYRERKEENNSTIVHITPQNNNNKDSSSIRNDDDDDDIAVATIDFGGVNFDSTKSEKKDDADDLIISKVEHAILYDIDSIPILQKQLLNNNKIKNSRWIKWIQWLNEGKYALLLREARVTPEFIFQNSNLPSKEELLKWINNNHNNDSFFILEMELISIAALNLYLQLNYTGPTLEETSKRRHLQDTDYDAFDDVVFAIMKNDDNDTKFHNAVLSELVVEGEWPCQVCLIPYWLWISRSFLSYIVETRFSYPCQVWSLRAAVSHTRLLLNSIPSPTSLWEEIRTGFMKALTYYCQDLKDHPSSEGQVFEEEDQDKYEIVSSLLLEWGLAQHYLHRPGMGRLSFVQAKFYSGLRVELTGSMGKRTKFQQTSLAQLKLEARNTRRRGGKKASSEAEDEKKVTDVAAEPIAKDIRVEHPEDTILFEKIKYDEDESDNSLSVLDQCILMAFCLDVKNTNPNKDVLTAEEMGAYLGRVLTHLDDTNNNNNDWMLYATALLERAWLEFQSSHARERALLQIQALLDQHTNRLSITQSTYDSVQKESSPVQERLRHLHKIVYPPRWYMIADTAERYAALGIVTSAAELFQEVEMWDQVVECYRRAGKETLATQIVEKQLAIPNNETPRMWAALGDLTNDPQYYHKALALSHGRFSSAWVALGKRSFDKGELKDAKDFYQKALALRPLAPTVWFRLGAIGMQLREWSLALEAFSHVVQQEPAEGDAWANIAAIHMHRKQPAQAYPALVESLKQNRNNWRVWHSKLYTCIDLQKYDEAVQACHVMMDLQSSRSKANIQPLEEHCVRAIIGGTFKNLLQNETQRVEKDESTCRSMTRVHDLLNRLSTQPPVEPWVYECQALVASQLSHQEEVILEQLRREYRSLQAVPGRWEKDRIQKLVRVVSQMSRFYLFSPADTSNKSKREKLVKCRFLVRGLVSKLRKLETYTEEDEIQKLETILNQVQTEQDKIEDEEKSQESG